MPITVSQVATENQEGMSFLVARKERWVRQLILMNNLRRADETIASTLLFSFFNRVFSNLYEDTLQVRFTPPSDQDYRAVQALSLLQRHDYQEMKKKVLDYDWTWDALFFGRGYMETLNFDKKAKLLKPTVLNPLVFYYDPFFPEKKNWRYYGKWILKSRHELKALQLAGKLEKDVNLDTLPAGMEPLLWSYKTRRDEAKELTPHSPEAAAVPSSESGAGTTGVYQILEHYTHDPDTGKKHIVWTDKNMAIKLRDVELDLKADDEGFVDWPLSVKECFREPHSSMPFSIPDLMEDKHRGLNVIYNLAYIAAKDEANPLYIYLESRVKDKAQLFQRQISQHIAIKGDGDPSPVIQPLRTKPALTTSLLQFANILSSESAAAVGTAMSSPLPQKGKKTATQAALDQQIMELTASLQGRALAQGEEDFWSQWYRRYEENMGKADEKFISISGTPDITFRTLKFGDIIGRFPPRIDVVSSKEAATKAMVNRKDMMTILPILQKSRDPKSFDLFMKHDLLPKFDMSAEAIDAIYPKTIDEIKAEQENRSIEEDRYMPVSQEEDDAEHLFVHMRAPNTAAKWAHVFAHEQQLARKQAEAKKAQPPPGGGAAPPAQAPAGGGQAPAPFKPPGVAEATTEAAAAPAAKIMQKAMRPNSPSPT